MLNGRGLEFLSEAMRDDKELALLAITHYPRAFEYISGALQSDPILIELSKHK